MKDLLPPPLASSRWGAGGHSEAVPARHASSAGPPSGAGARRLSGGKRPGADRVGGEVDASAVPGILDQAHRRTTAGLLMLVTFIAFEAMAVGTAMPTAVAELDGLAWYGWPFSAFLVASVVGMVIGGDAADRGSPCPGASASSRPVSSWPGWPGT